MSQMKPEKKMDDQESQEVGDRAQPEAEVVIEPGRVRGRRRSRSAGTETSVNMDELRELIQLIRENDFTEFELEREGFRVRFRRGGDVASESDNGPQDSVPAVPTEVTGSTTTQTKITTTNAPVHP